MRLRRWRHPSITSVFLTVMATNDADDATLFFSSNYDLILKSLQSTAGCVGHLNCKLPTRNAPPAFQNFLQRGQLNEAGYSRSRSKSLRQWKRSEFNKGPANQTPTVGRRDSPPAIRGWCAGDARRGNAARGRGGDLKWDELPGKINRRTSAWLSNRGGCCLGSSTWRIQLEHTSCTRLRATTRGKLPLQFVWVVCVCVRVCLASDHTRPALASEPLTVAQ